MRSGRLLRSEQQQVRGQHDSLLGAQRSVFCGQVHELRGDRRRLLRGCDGLHERLLRSDRQAMRWHRRGLLGREHRLPRGKLPGLRREWRRVLLRGHAVFERRMLRPSGQEMRRHRAGVHHLGHRLQGRQLLRLRCHGRYVLPHERLRGHGLLRHQQQVLRGWRRLLDRNRKHLPRPTRCQASTLA